MPAMFEPQAPGETFEFASPLFKWCDYTQDWFDLSVKFYDSDLPEEAGQDPLDWVSLDRDTG